jgi:hypothetical protein
VRSGIRAHAATCETDLAEEIDGSGATRRKLRIAVPESPMAEDLGMPQPTDAAATSSLFDQVARTNVDAARHSESSFEYLNRTDGPFWSRIRDLMDEWWNQHPESARANVRGQIRSRDDHSFQAAFFEMYGYQVLRRVRNQIIEHPVTGTNRQPDFLATSEGLDPLVMEMTSMGVADQEKAARARLSTVYDQVNSWAIPNFWLRLNVVKVGAGNPSLRRLRNELLAWIDGLDVDEIVSRTAASGHFLASGSAPEYVWDDAGWIIEFGVIGRPPDRRTASANAIGMFGPSGAWVSDAIPIRRRLADKAGGYGKFGGPFVVAILLNVIGPDDHSVAAALYGDEIYTFPMNDPDAGQMGRRRNGSWFAPDGWHHTNVSAILAVSGLLPWTVTTAVPTLWHHPKAQYPIDGIAPLFRQAVPNPTTGSVDFVAPMVEPATFFGLPPDWPGPEPRFPTE